MSAMLRRRNDRGALPPPALAPALQCGFRVSTLDARGLPSCENRPRTQLTPSQVHPTLHLLDPRVWHRRGIDDSDCLSKSLDPNDPPRLANPLRQAIYINDRDNPQDILPPCVLHDIGDLPLRIQLTFAANFAELAVRRRMCIIHNRVASSNAEGGFTRGAGMNGLISAIGQVNEATYPPPVDKVDDGYSELRDIIKQANEYTRSSIGGVDRVNNRRGNASSLNICIDVNLRSGILLYERDSPYDEFSDPLAQELASLNFDESQDMLACLYTELAIRRRLCMTYQRGRTTSMILNTPTFHNEVLLREASGAPADIPRNEALPVPGMTGLRDALEQATEVYVANARQHPWHELKDLICLAQECTYEVIGEEPRHSYHSLAPPVFGEYTGNLT